MQRSLEVLRRVGGSPHVRWIAIAAGLLLTAPSLFAGLASEDHVLRAIARGPAMVPPWHVNLWGLDSLILPADRPAYVLALKSFGAIPWIADERFIVALWRPLASWTHHLDWRFAGAPPWVAHLHSLAWYAGAIAAAASAHRRFASTAVVAGVATLLFAVDDAHGHAVGWIANRSALLATTFGLLALASQDRLVRDGARRWSARLAPSVWLLLALLSSEYGVGALGFLVAHAWVLDPAPRWRRVLGALPWLATTALWAAAYRALGHGSEGSGVYVDPLVAPLAFAASASTRWVALAAGLFAAPPSDVWNAYPPDSIPWLLAPGVLIVALVIGLLRPSVATPTTRFWALGTALALVPACAAFPQDRLLVLPSAGSAALLAELLGAAPVDAARRVGAWLLFAVHAVVAPAALPWRSLTMHRYERDLAAARESALALVRTPRDHLLLVNAPDWYFGSHVLLSRDPEGDPTPPRTLVLAGTLRRTEVTRVDVNSVVVRPEGGFFLETFNRIYRALSAPVAAGQSIYVPGLQITFLETSPEGQPLAVRFRADRRLEAPTLRWARWEGGRYVEVQPPAVGETLVVGGEGGR
ncbi:MAG: hypothetical protein IT376_08625 [Polyangiaceae bacterium]|nr:hypothetical protein [Polyangiaceae bacterium]